MKNKTEKTFGNFAWWLGVIAVGFALGITLQFVRAWTEPTVAPPGGNVGAPINTGNIDQSKAGGFTASSLKAGMIEGTTVKGTTQLCIGTDCRTAWPSGGEGSQGCAECYFNGLYGVGSDYHPPMYYPCGTTIRADALCGYLGNIYTCLEGSWSITGTYLVTCW